MLIPSFSDWQKMRASLLDLQQYIESNTLHIHVHIVIFFKEVGWLTN